MLCVINGDKSHRNPTSHPDVAPRLMFCRVPICRNPDLTSQKSKKRKADRCWRKKKKKGFMAWFMAWFMGGFRIWDMIDDCWGWLVIWFMLICDDLWWFVMICDDLWWFAMICDDLHDWHWFALIWWCFICSCIHWHQSFLWLKETSCKVPPQLCLLVYDPDYIINHICSYHQP